MYISLTALYNHNRLNCKTFLMANLLYCFVSKLSYQLDNNIWFNDYCVHV